MKPLPRSLQKPLSDSSSYINPTFAKKLKTSLFTGENMTKTSSTREKIRNFIKINKFVPVGISLAFIALLGIGAYNFGFTKSEDAVLRSVELPSDLSDIKSIDEIRTLANNGIVEGLTISSVELEQEDGVLLYKVHYSDGTYKLFDARTGEMVTKPDLEVDTSVPIDFVAGVSIESARATAQSVFPDKVIQKIELESENGIIVYSVRFTDDTRVDISAIDGSIVRTRNGATETRTSDDNNDDSSDDSSHSSNNSNEVSDDSSDDNSSNSDDDKNNSGSGSSNSGRRDKNDRNDD